MTEVELNIMEPFIVEVWSKGIEPFIVEVDMDGQ